MSPPANERFPYAFFLDASRHPFQPDDTGFNLRNAWWLADAALLAYSSESAVRAAFARLPEAVDLTFLNAGASTQAYIAASDRWIMLALRGTQVDRFWEAVRDWMVNLHAVPVKDSAGDLVHAGFARALDEIWPEARTRIRERQQARRRPLWLTGHSLGAALATLAARQCAGEQALGLAGVYTYGSPRTGDRRFGQRITAPVFRFRHHQDVVAHLPLGPVLQHVGAAHYIDAAGAIRPAMSSVAEALLDAGIAARRLVRRLTRPSLEVTLPRVLSDHAPLNYSILIWNGYESVAGAATGPR